jgi:hypothetical protein
MSNDKPCVRVECPPEMTVYVSSSSITSWGSDEPFKRSVILNLVRSHFKYGLSEVHETVSFNFEHDPLDGRGDISIDHSLWEDLGRPNQIQVTITAEEP